MTTAEPSNPNFMCVGTTSISNLVIFLKMVLPFCLFNLDAKHIRENYVLNYSIVSSYYSIWTHENYPCGTQNVLLITTPSYTKDGTQHYKTPPKWVLQPWKYFPLNMSICFYLTSFSSTVVSVYSYDYFRYFTFNNLFYKHCPNINLLCHNLSLIHH